MAGPTFIELLESRQFLSVSTADHAGCPLQNDALDAPVTETAPLKLTTATASTIQHSVTAKPARRLARATASAPNFVGSYKGALKSAFFSGSAKTNFTVTSQKPNGAIKGNVSIAGADPVNFSAKGKFKANGAFTFTFNNPGTGAVITLTGTRKASDGSLKGSFKASAPAVTPEPVTGTFSFKRVA